MTWLWAYDKRLFCGMHYTKFSYVFVWLVPVIIAATVLILTTLAKKLHSKDQSKCFEDSEAAEQA